MEARLIWNSTTGVTVNPCSLLCSWVESSPRRLGGWVVEVLVMEPLRNVGVKIAKVHIIVQIVQTILPPNVSVTYFQISTKDSRYTCTRKASNHTGTDPKILNPHVVAYRMLGNSILISIAPPSIIGSGYHFLHVVLVVVHL